MVGDLVSVGQKLVITLHLVLIQHVALSAKVFRTFKVSHSMFNQLLCVDFISFSVF